MSFSLGTFPEALKISIVKPLFKKDEQFDIKNYRPISLIPIIAKIYEKFMYKRLINYCTKFKIICYEQYGYQTLKPTHQQFFT